MTTTRLRASLLEWYSANRRDLPWRRTSDPYAIWVSEIMLQQTRVTVVEERFVAFLERFPTVTALAGAAEQNVLGIWSGLGYYRRARMLHKAAKQVAEELGGKLPVTSKELRLLPGIGAYTGAAIASIAHGEPIAVVDGNVERVLCRLRGWEADGSTEVRRRVEKRAAELVDPESPGDFNQAMMELGATVCTPRNPLCLQCPIVDGCSTRGEHKTQARAPMQSRDVAYALALRSDPASGQLSRQVLLEQRPGTQSVMPGLWELPPLLEVEVPAAELQMNVRHAIMQVNYNVRIRAVGEKRVKMLTVAGGERRWVPLHEAAEMALTGLARKVLGRAQLLPSVERKKGTKSSIEKNDKGS